MKTLDSILIMMILSMIITMTKTIKKFYVTKNTKYHKEEKVYKKGKKIYSNAYSEIHSKKEGNEFV
jgi:hypothetical protein